MITETVRVHVSAARVTRENNGAGLAAILAAGIGALAVGFFVILNESGLLAAPALYPPAGGVSGRTTFAVVTWLVAWAVLHARWRSRELAPGRITALALAFVAIGIVLTFPPVWSVF